MAQVAVWLLTGWILSPLAASQSFTSFSSLEKFSAPLSPEKSHRHFNLHDYLPQTRKIEGGALKATSSQAIAQGLPASCSTQRQSRGGLRCAPAAASIVFRRQLLQQVRPVARDDPADFVEALKSERL
jgi:hypothetical protein